MKAFGPKKLSSPVLPEELSRPSNQRQHYKKKPNRKYKSGRLPSTPNGMGTSSSFPVRTQIALAQQCGPGLISTCTLCKQPLLHPHLAKSWVVPRPWARKNVCARKRCRWTAPHSNLEWECLTQRGQRELLCRSAKHASFIKDYGMSDKGVMPTHIVTCVPARKISEFQRLFACAIMPLNGINAPFLLVR